MANALSEELKKLLLGAIGDPASTNELINVIESDGGGSVTSVALSVPSIFSVSGSPITSSGTITVSSNTQTANTFFAGPSAGGAIAPAFRNIVAADVPVLNQNTTGTALNVTGIVAIANGGSGQSSANASLNAFLPSQAAHAGEFLTTDGTNTSWAAATGGANTTLSNLAVTSINADLLPATDGTGPNLGSSTKRWQNIAVLFATDNLSGTTINFRDRQLVDNNTDTISLDWQNRTANSSSGAASLNWDTPGVLDAQGSSIRNYVNPARIVTGSGTLSSVSDYKIVLTDAAGVSTLTLPAGVNGLSFIISSQTAAYGATYTLIPNGGDLIDGAVSISGNDLSIVFISGTWYVC